MFSIHYINGVAKNLGVSVKFVDSIKSQGGQSVNGSYSDGTIKISMEVLNNPNAETDEVRNKVAEIIFKHGITHRIQHLAPKQFERFRDLAYEYVSNKNSSNLTEVEKQLLKEYESGVDMNYSEAVDEIVADFVGSADFAEHVAVKDKNLAQKILDVIRDILDKIGVKKYSEMDNIARVWEKAVNTAEKNVNNIKVGNGQTTENAKFSTNKNITVDETSQKGGKSKNSKDENRTFKRDKYFDRLVDKWQNLDSGTHITIGDIKNENPLHKIGFKSGKIYMDVSKLQLEMEKHGDHLSTSIVKKIPDLISKPIAITEYKPEQNTHTVSLYGELYTETGTPITVGIMVSDSRSGNVITKIRTIHAIGNLKNQITDKSILYLHENKKETNAWFQAQIGIDAPLGGTQLGVIRSIDFYNSVPQTNTEVNTFDKNNSENPSTKFSSENMNDGKADNQSNNNNDVKYSTKNADELIENAEKASADTGKITKDMPDEERSKIISQKRITVPTYNEEKFEVIKDFDINTLKNTYKSKAFPIIKTINKYFNITNKTYSKKDIELDFEYSKASLNESMHKDYDDFAKLLSVFDDVVNNAVGIEVLDDKYEDESLENMYVMASAFNDGNRIVPVQLEIKNYSDRANKLYLTVTLDKNQRNSDVSTSLGQNQLHNGITVPSDISISDLVKAVNASNRKFLKYFPDDMLNKRQISAKQKALKADEERINQYRNGEKQKHSKKLQSLMQKSGLTACQLLRKFILETEIRPRPPDEYAQLLRELSAIGNNINQMAYKANGLGEICVEEVRAMRVAFEKLYKEVKR